ncbi:hypothetical protein conserved [Leishmania donovani]|uniref:Hypothetical_protein_conserved n=1 Tax=Leishmania donovani TaxID=5661 RepID=A0A6J8FGZ7_LEIDO|nr:hypothetical protein conserved [Leishmania donovani]VDZ47010.1 hypothetical_protein_conserved [Leishmania donovani]
MDETVHYLHHLPRLQVLTLKECPLAALPNYRSRVLAFVRGLKFFDGHLVRQDEAAKAREAFRENLLTVDEEDEARAAAAKLQADQEIIASSYQQYNCPNEVMLFDELLHLDPEGRHMEAILRSDAVFPVAKEPLDRYQTEFNEQVRQLTAAMKDIRERRDADDATYREASPTRCAKALLLRWPPCSVSRRSRRGTLSKASPSRCPARRSGFPVKRPGLCTQRWAS